MPSDLWLVALLVLPFLGSLVAAVLPSKARTAAAPIAGASRLSVSASPFSATPR